MRLADFIEANMETVLQRWEDFARTLTPASGGLDVAALRDHAQEILRAVAADLRTSQTRAQQGAKSRGEAPRLSHSPETAAETHATLRAVGGFTMQQMVAEYRALRSTVLTLWGDAHAPGPETIADITRFNEAIDQAIAESVDFFTLESERWRDVFLGILGHDLRGPLNSMLLTAQVLAELTRGTTASEVTGRLLRSGERMTQLLNDLLDYSRGSLELGLPVSRASTDLAAICRDEIDLQRGAWPRNEIGLVCDVPTEGVWDASRLKQVLGNLIANAAKYGDPGASITVRLQGAAEHVVLSVENLGQPVIARGAQSIFEPFRRGGNGDAETERTSLGLGLFIVRQIVHAHGGSVKAVSAEGKTVFSATLPRTPPAAGT
jgi:signal transduction histidine kinase